jgi:predicted kinase
MALVYFLSGPRGAGKTNFANRIRSEIPSILCFELDAKCKEKIGSIYFDPALAPMIKKIVLDLITGGIRKTIHETSTKGAAIIDVRNIRPRNRARIAEFIRSNGGERINCLFFTTPLQQCQEWFMCKPENERSGETIEDIADEYKEFHKQTTDINYPQKRTYTGNNPSGFDAIIRIDPADPESVDYMRSYIKDSIRR